MSDTNVPEYEGWAVVEIMGHKTLAGYIREAAMYGTAMLRIDIPGEDDAAMGTQYYGGGAIYCVTPCSEDIARARSKRIRETPEAIAYALPEPKRCDGAWGFSTPCSPDIARDDHDSDATICGRHQLQRAHESAPPDEEAELMDPRD